MGLKFGQAAPCALALVAGVVLGTCAQLAGPASPAAKGAAGDSARGNLGQVLPAAATRNMAATDAVHPHPKEIRLWDGVAPGSEGKDSPEVVAWRTENDSITNEPFSFPTVTNIHFPSITPYLPAKDKATGAAVIVCPGGGHMFHTINHEGYDVGQYLADHGVAAFVLKYRLARAPGSTYTIQKDALADGQRSLRYVRAHAAEWGINPDHIGMIGFSAGGEVAVQVNLNPVDGKPDAADPIERVSCKMNFEGLIYPGVSRLIAPTKDWPAVFLACSADDRADIAGTAGTPNAATRPASTGLADVYLRYKAVSVPAELHIYSEGGHGFGVRDRPIAEAQWADRFLDWLKDRAMTAK